MREEKGREGGGRGGGTSLSGLRIHDPHHFLHLFEGPGLHLDGINGNRTAVVECETTMICCIAQEGY